MSSFEKEDRPRSFQKEEVQKSEIELNAPAREPKGQSTRKDSSPRFDRNRGQGRRGGRGRASASGSQYNYHHRSSGSAAQTERFGDKPRCQESVVDAEQSQDDKYRSEGGGSRKKEIFSESKRRGKQERESAYGTNSRQRSGKESGRSYNRKQKYSSEMRNNESRTNAQSNNQDEIQARESDDKVKKAVLSTTGRVVDGKYVRSELTHDNSYNHERKIDNKERSNQNNQIKADRGRFAKKNQNGSYSFQNRPSLRPPKKSLPIDSEQARMLTDQLAEESYECMVCCDRVRSSQPIWTCENCYHLFHLKCIKQWAGSEIASTKGEGNGWRCPACQNVTNKMPMKYTCFCGKVTNPDWNPRDGVTPHSCGELCWKHRRNPPCSHTCNELCHPGPCPSCPVMVLKECHCGNTNTKVRCGHTKTMKCNNVCDKLLSCRKHTCTLLCHEGPCEECSVFYAQQCYCGKEKRDRNCGDASLPFTVDNFGIERYSCERACAKMLDCGNHACEDHCHDGDCKSCPDLPKNVEYCPCKQTLVADLLQPGQERKSCLDPIPCCNNFCGKKLPCGTKGQSHLCKRSCHVGECGPCSGTTVTSCRCGNTELELPCTEFDPGKENTCDRRCNKKRACGRHRCNQKCCVDENHICSLICGRKLACGLHKCEEICHPGSCPRCWQTSFDERLCYCGMTVQYPPIPCGAPMLECSNQCTRQHPCNHEPKHNCHSEDICPPCVVLVEKPCLCGRVIRRNVPCHINIVFCGKPCDKKLECGHHKCLKICHKGQCLTEGEQCQQPCSISRRDCPHACAAPCHLDRDCPEGPCKSQIIIKCKCGRKTEKVLCLAGNSKVQFQRFATDSVGDKLRNLRAGQSVDISGLMVAEKRGVLECDGDCAVFERNKRLAEALGVENPDQSHFQSYQASPFSFFLKEEGKKQLPLVKLIEDSIENLIQKIKKSTGSQLSHSFQPMNSTQRKLVHELAEYYNCKTTSYDPEPNRNTVVTATRDSCLVTPKLSSVLERKNKLLPQPVTQLIQEKPLNFQRMQKKTTQDSLGEEKSSTVDYFGDDFME